MRARLLLDGGAPKVPPEELRKLVEKAGFDTGPGRADFGIVVGGDGKFSRYGRTEDVPLLFVGVRTKGITGSRAILARTTYDRLPRALAKIRSGNYTTEVHRRLGVVVNGKGVGEVFTDVYLQRGDESTCIRYRVEVTGPGLKISEAAIGDGVVVTTKAGATGYYSYIDRIKGDSMDPKAHADLEEGEVGICHVTPTFTEREGTSMHPLRFRVPWGSRIDISLTRDADARLYGAVDSRAGVRIALNDRITVVPGKKVTRVISL
ncbi:MAG TPA: hypothetical protein VJR06_02355 [Nitrososphaerales archaeon]|nr:hypothetical protein [Nitrososphaerales archaeon]